MPVILGGGKSIFPEDGAQHTLELVSAVTSDAGVQVCIYKPGGRRSRRRLRPREADRSTAASPPGPPNRA